MPKKKINSDKDNKSVKKDEINKIVDNIYDSSENAKRITKPIYRHGSRLWYILVIIIVGFLAGVVGELSVNNYFNHQGYNLTNIWQAPTESEDKQQVIVFKKEEVAQNKSDQVKTLVNNAAQSVVGIYLKRGGEAVVDQVYQPRDKVGNALVMTSDGWLVTTVSGMPQKEGQELVVLNSAKEILPVEKIVFDEAAQIVFLKVQAENLKVVKFSDNIQIYSGLPVIILAESLVSESIQAEVTSVEKVRWRPVVGFADYFSSSEKYDTFLMLKNQLPQDFVGGAVIDLEGGIVGLYSGKYSQKSVVPAVHFLNIFDQLLRKQEIVRPYFGVRYLDLAIALGLDATISENLTKGALIFGDSDHNINAVAVNSPAAKAGLKLGDIILQVNNDPVDERHSLTELLQQYQIGDVVKLIVQNSNVVREVEVGLVESSVK